MRLRMNTGKRKGNKRKTKRGFYREKERKKIIPRFDRKEIMNIKKEKAEKIENVERLKKKFEKKQNKKYRKQIKEDKVKAEEKQISSSNSKVAVWIVPTEEELMIARDTAALI